MLFPHNTGDSRAAPAPPPFQLTTLSAISSSSHSPGQPVQAGDKIVLNWK